MRQFSDADTTESPVFVASESKRYKESDAGKWHSDIAPWCAACVAF